MELKSQEIIFNEGEYQKWMFAIRSGSVSIYSGFGTPYGKKLVTLTPGQLFGEIGMIGMLPRTATAVAAEDGTVLEQITYEDMETYLQEHPEYIQQIMKNVSHRIRELTEDLTQVNREVQTLVNTRRSGGAVGNLAQSLKKMLSGLKKRDLSGEKLAKASGGCTEDEEPGVMSFRAGDVLFREGDQADVLCQICSGVVGIYKDYGTPSEKRLTTLFTGDSFGEMGLLDEMPRSATAVCLENTSIRLVGKAHFKAYFRKNPGTILDILQRMCMRLRSLSAEYLKICTTLEDLSTVQDAGQEQTWAQLEDLSKARFLEDQHEEALRADWNSIN